MACLELLAKHRTMSERLYRIYADGRVAMVTASTEGQHDQADLAFCEEVRRRLGR